MLRLTELGGITSNKLAGKIMATYTEIRNLAADDELRNKITVAVVKFVTNQITGTPTAADKAFADQVITNPDVWGRRVTNLVLAQYSDLTVAQIQAATDAQIQTGVDAVAPSLRDALAGV